MSKFKPNDDVWFYCNPDNLTDPLSCVLQGKVTSYTEEYKVVSDFSGTVTKEVRKVYNLEVVWDDFTTTEENIFETELEARSHAKQNIESRIVSIRNRLALFENILRKLSE